MRVLVSGGGTAGHIYPALTVAGVLIADGHDVAFVGTPDGLEARLAAEAGVSFHAVDSHGFDRGNPITLVTSAFTVLGSVRHAARIVREFGPDVIIGFGGYVSLPIGLVAAVRRIPLVLHEQNSVPGLANRVLSRWATAVAVTYADSIGRLVHPERAVVSGNPVRPSVREASAARGRHALGLADDDLVLLVFGGSRGARHINNAMVALARRLLEETNACVVHVAGRDEAADVMARIATATGSTRRYRVVDYIDEMGDAIAAADLIVARAGATSLAEITAIGRASLLVPYPYATDDHQTGNAHAVSEAGGAIIVADNKLDSAHFADSVIELLRDSDRRARMAHAARGLGRPDAAERVAAVALDVAGSRKESR